MYNSIFLTKGIEVVGLIFSIPIKFKSLDFLSWFSTSFLYLMKASIA